MKRLHLIIMLTVAFLLAGCTKQETPVTPTPQQNSIVGTKWTTSYSDDSMVIEFASNSEVIGYFANSSGGIIGDVFNGTYYKSGNTITFKNFRLRWIYAYYELQTGTISGSVISTRGKECWNIESNTWVDWNKNWVKK